MTWILYMFLFAGIHGVILALLFLTNSAKKKKLLGLYLLLFSFVILQYTAFWHGSQADFKWLMFLGATSSWLLPPTLYYYLQSRDRYSVWHLLPAIIFAIYWISTQLGLVPVSIIRMLGPGGGISLLRISYYTIYLIIILRSVKLSFKENHLIFSLAGMLAGLLFYHLALKYDVYSLQVDYLICAIFILTTYVVIYRSQLDFLKESVVKSYATSSMTTDDAVQIIEKINTSMTEGQEYLDQSLNLSELASKLRIPKYRISQALNTQSEQSFSELINHHRVQHAAKLLRDDQYDHLKVEAIGEMSGFNNKVSFYKNFKKLYGVAPGLYRDQVSSVSS